MDITDVLGDPGDSDDVRMLAAVLAGAERDLHAAIQDHYAALGVEPPPDRDSPEVRIDRLRTLVDHLFADDLWGYFLAVEAPESLKNTERASAYAGVDDDRWETTIQRWATTRRETGASGSDRELAGAVVEERFGVSLDTFEGAVVGFSPARTLRRAFRGPIDDDIRRLRAATHALNADETERD